MLIEGDLQINMRIQLNADSEELIEKDRRFSTANFGSRKNYAIETAILKKRSICNNSLVEMKKTAHNFTNLKSYYDCQLPNIGSIVEESVGRNRAAMKLLTKIMLCFKHCASTGYGISQQYYGGEEYKLAGTGQGNKFSGNMCREVSCAIMRHTENKLIGIFFADPGTRCVCAPADTLDHHFPGSL